MVTKEIEITECMNCPFLSDERSECDYPSWGDGLSDQSIKIEWDDDLGLITPDNCPLPDEVMLRKKL